MQCIANAHNFCLVMKGLTCMIGIGIELLFYLGKPLAMGLLHKAPRNSSPIKSCTRIYCNIKLALYIYKQMVRTLHKPIYLHYKYLFFLQAPPIAVVKPVSVRLSHRGTWLWIAHHALQQMVLSGNLVLHSYFNTTCLLPRFLLRTSSRVPLVATRVCVVINHIPSQWTFGLQVRPRHSTSYKALTRVYCAELLKFYHQIEYIAVVLYHQWTVSYYYLFQWSVLYQIT